MLWSKNYSTRFLLINLKEVSFDSNYFLIVISLKFEKLIKILFYEGILLHKNPLFREAKGRNLFETAIWSRFKTSVNHIESPESEFSHLNLKSVDKVRLSKGFEVYEEKTGRDEPKMELPWFFALKIGVLSWNSGSNEFKFFFTSQFGEWSIWKVSLLKRSYFLNYDFKLGLRFFEW